MKESQHLYFLDALRAFAILMMLQGHFVSGILDPLFKDTTNSVYNLWLYCRGFTAPVFFTVTGWVVLFLLLKNPIQGLQNPRVKKGLKRGLELILWGYVLRLNLPMLLNGQLNGYFLKPDVLQIIGLGLIFTVSIYAMFHYLKQGLGFVFLGIGLLIFITEPGYVDTTFLGLPKFLAAYLTKANGGVFYLFPWLGYVSLGACIAIVFGSQPKQFLMKSMGFVALGLLLIYKSSAFFIWVYDQTDWMLFRQVAYNNFLFIRLGDVFLLIAGFMALNRIFSKGFWLWIGQKTLSVYIVHYFIFYGSLFGIGIYKYYKYSGTLLQSAIGALFFMAICLIVTYYAHRYRSKLFFIHWNSLKIKRTPPYN